MCLFSFLYFWSFIPFFHSFFSHELIADSFAYAYFKRREISECYACQLHGLMVAHHTCEYQRQYRVLCERRHKIWDQAHDCSRDVSMFNSTSQCFELPKYFSKIPSVQKYLYYIYWITVSAILFITKIYIADNYGSNEVLLTDLLSEFLADMWLVGS